jgi:hypothetical protein
MDVNAYRVDMIHRESGNPFYEIFFEKEEEAINYMMKKEASCEMRNLYLRLMKWNEQLNQYEEI